MANETQLSMLVRALELLLRHIRRNDPGMVFSEGVQSQDAEDILGCIEACQIASRVTHG